VHVEQRFFRRLHGHAPAVNYPLIAANLHLPNPPYKAHNRAARLVGLSDAVVLPARGFRARADLPGKSTTSRR